MKAITKEESRLAGGVHPNLVGHVPAQDSKFDQYGLPKGLGVKKQQIGTWELLTCGQPIHMDHEEIEQSLEILRNWRKCFAGGVRKTLIQKKFGTHSAVVRLDYFRKQRLGVQLCEVEERPAGLFATAMVNRQFRDPLMAIMGGVERAFGKRIAFCVSEGRANDSDDEDFVRLYRWGKGPEGGFEPTNCPLIRGVPDKEMIDKYVWWVRSLRSEEAYYALEPHAISSIAQEGSKEYGVLMGLWFRIPANWPQVIPLEHGVVLKPEVGSRFEEAMIVQMENRSSAAKKGKLDAGVHGFSDAKRAIESGRVAYWQPFYPPEKAPFLDGTSYRVLRRAYYGFDFSKDTYVPMGGMWFAHDTARIHGAKNALCGPLRLPS